MGKNKLISNGLSLLFGALMGLGAFYAYYKFLSTPRAFDGDNFSGACIDWSIDISAGLTVGIIFFFVAWGHFQEITPDDRTSLSTEQTKPA